MHAQVVMAPGQIMTTNMGSVQIHAQGMHLQTG